MSTKRSASEELRRLRESSKGVVTVPYQQEPPRRSVVTSLKRASSQDENGQRVSKALARYSG
jgi:hypothetical protein